MVLNFRVDQKKLQNGRVTFPPIMPGMNCALNLNEDACSALMLG